jgi:hypothetical protein
VLDFISAALFTQERLPKESESERA